MATGPFAGVELSGEFSQAAMELQTALTLALLGVVSHIDGSEADEYELAKFASSYFAAQVVRVLIETGVSRQAATQAALQAIYGLLEGCSGLNELESSSSGPKQ